MWPHLQLSLHTFRVPNNEFYTQSSPDRIDVWYSILSMSGVTARISAANNDADNDSWYTAAVFVHLLPGVVVRRH